VIYGYHNQVDAIGDTASTEAQTFQAVRTAITDIADTVRYIVNTLNGNYVVITADHGFLFTETTPGTPEKSPLAEKPPGTVTAKKRYLIGHDLPEADQTWHGTTLVTAVAEGGMEFYEVHFSYLNQATMDETFITVPEQGGGTLIPQGRLNPGVLHRVAHGSSGHLGLYRLETQVTAGNGALRTSGLGNSSTAREAVKVGFDYFKANVSHV